MDAEIWGESEAILAVKSRLSRAAKVNRPVLIIGERGTGKELAASRLHYLSPRWQGPYLTLNCAALAPGLLESELFGHESGAFTGAGPTRPGRFEAADTGTLFLDEISHLSLAAQAKILRVVEYGSFQRLGSHREMKVDVRLVSASNVDLWARAEAGKFRPDLLDRLSFEVITLPPLREREGDIPLLARLFAARMARELGFNQAPTFTPAADEALARRPWPGNVRELKNTVERQVFNQVFDLDRNGFAADRQGFVIDRQVFDLDHNGFAAGRQDFDQGRNGSAADRQNLVPDQSPAGYGAERASPPGPEAGPRISAHNAWPEGEFDRRTAAYALGLFQEALKEARHNQREAARLLGLTYHRFRFLHKKARSIALDSGPEGYGDMKRPPAAPGAAN